jgi:hypothetical protein
MRLFSAAPNIEQEKLHENKCFSFQKRRKIDDGRGRRW